MTALRDTLLGQLDIAWQLTSYHLDGLTTDACLWRPAPRGLHVVRAGDVWRAEWPESEGYDIGPTSIAWITWHITFWWSMAIDHAFGAKTLAREHVTWPGNAEAVRSTIADLHARWREQIGTLDDNALRERRATWPIDRPLGEIVAWANLELMKNAAELGYARFLYAVR